MRPGAMRYGSYIGKKFIDEAAANSALLKLVKISDGDGVPVASGTNGVVSHLPFVVKRPKNTNYIKYNGNVLDKIDKDPMIAIILFGLA